MVTDLYWKLDGRTPVPATDEEFDQFQRAVVLGTADHHVALQRDEASGVTVSTIFLGINTSLANPPRVFETMIFGGEHDTYQVRSTTWDEAEAEHANALRIAGLLP